MWPASWGRCRRMAILASCPTTERGHIVCQSQGTVAIATAPPYHPNASYVVTVGRGRWTVRAEATRRLWLHVALSGTDTSRHVTITPASTPRGQPAEG